MKAAITTAQKMKAIAQSEYGSPDVLRLEEVDRPNVAEDSVLVKVRASAVHAGDWHLMRGTPFLLRFIYGGLRQPQIKILGTDVAGVVAAVGKNVNEFKPGDEVFGDLSESGFGGFAEYVAVPARMLALKPINLNFEQAATLPVSGVTALQGLRDVGQLQAGQRVLIKGASGGVGSFAVQIAKAFGAEVTAMCSPSKIDMVRELGADFVVEPDASLKVRHYDLIFDAAAYSSLLNYSPALVRGGKYILVGGSTPRLLQVMLFGFLISRVARRQVKFLVCQPNREDLKALKEMVESEKVRPYIDRCYPLSEVPAAISYVESRQVRGKVAIAVSGS